MKLNYKLRQLLRIPYCIYMCIKYPFLYPRNRFSGLHYNNWRIQNKLKNLQKKYHVFCYLDEGVSSEPFSKECYFKQTGHCIEYWKNYWAKPLYHIIKFYHNVVLQIIFCLTMSTEWYSLEKGWKIAFGNQYLKELKTQLKKDKMLYKFRIIQIKEKWGRLQLYPAFASEKVYSIISKYEDLSWHYCIDCGAPATHVSKGWVCPYCKKCVKENNLDANIKTN